jgi:hypothetical protein
MSVLVYIEDIPDILINRVPTLPYGIYPVSPTLKGKLDNIILNPISRYLAKHIPNRKMETDHTNTSTF